MVSLINTNNGVKEPTHGYQICNTNQILILDGSVKSREALHTRVIIWVTIILNHIDIGAILPRYQKKYEIITINTWVVSKIGNIIRPTLVQMPPMSRDLFLI